MDFYLFVGFFAFFLLLAAWRYLYLRGKSPAVKKRFHPRFVILNSIIVGAFMMAILISWGQLLFAFVMLIALVAITVLKLTKERICETCGRYISPQNLIHAARVCPHCGSDLSPSILLRRRS